MATHGWRVDAVRKRPSADNGAAGPGALPSGALERPDAGSSCRPSSGGTMRSFRKAHDAAPSVSAGTGPGPATTPPAPEPPAATETGAVATEPSQGKALRNVLGVLRLALGWIFLWAFLDKLFA